MRRKSALYVRARPIQDFLDVARHPGILTNSINYALTKHFSRNISQQCVCVCARLIFCSVFVVIAFFTTISTVHAQEASPSILPSYKVFSSGPQAVTISDTDGSAVLHVTTDGSTPNSGSPTYTGDFNVSATTTVKAIAIGTSGTSAVTTSVVQIDASTATLPRTNLLAWHKADNGAVTNGTSVLTNWVDVTGNGYNATAQNSPTLVTSSINGLPSVAFNGGNTYVSVR